MQTIAFTPEQQKANIKEAIKDLRENKVKTKFQMFNPDTLGRCCLKVMADTARRITGQYYDRDENGNQLDNCPRHEMEHVFGIKSVFGETQPKMCEGFNFYLSIDDGYYLASEHNDGVHGAEKSHKQIADAIEEKYL